MQPNGEQLRVRLRLHHGGTFTKVPGEAEEWRYSVDKDGSIFNVTLDATTNYADFCNIVNSKVRSPCSIKYQSPGEPLAPDSLVTVSDDADLQELVNEYMDALQRPGTEMRTFRIHVFLQQALTYEIAPEEVMDASLACHDEINYDDYCGGDCCGEGYSSCDPVSSDTGWQPPARLQTVAAVTAMAGTDLSHAQLGTVMQTDPSHTGARQAYGAWPAQWGADAATAGTALGVGGLAAAGPLWHDEVVTPRGQEGHIELNQDKFHLEDPYLEDQSPLPGGLPINGQVKTAAATAPGPPFAGSLLKHEAERAGIYAANGHGLVNGMEAKEGALGPASKPAGHPTRGLGGSLYNRPLSSRVRDAIGALPSHISAFGEGGSRGASLNLPSHISAFGEGTAHEADTVAPQDAQVSAQDDPGIGGWKTQEFPGTASMQHMSQGNDEAAADGHDKQGAGSGSAMAPPTPKALDSVFKLPRANVTSVVKIGEGAFGEVSCADVFPFGSVAIKWLKKDRFAKYSESFQREAEVLSKLNHPNIIRMYGLVTEPASSPPSSAAHGTSAIEADGLARTNSSKLNGPIIIAGIMMEYLRGGSLAQRFRTLAHAGRRLGLKERCRIALQAALGMSYLHDQSPAVIHFDLKPDNLLLEGEGDSVLVKVADFGLSKHKIQSYVTCHDLRGTLPYMAPELVKCPNQVCEKCDVWSMGVVMWEMVTLEVPFQELTAQDILRGLMQGSLHLRMPSTCEPEWQQLITSCMEPEPSRRPTFRQLTERLEEMWRQLASVPSGAASGSGNVPGPLQQLNAAQLHAAPALAAQQQAIVVQQQQQQAVAAAAAAAAAANLMQLQQQQQQQQQAVAAAAVAAAAAAPFAHLQAGPTQQVGYTPLFTPLYAHPPPPSSSPHLPAFYGENSGLFGDAPLGNAAAAVMAYGPDNALFNQMDLLGITAQHGLQTATPLPNHHNPLLHGLHHCQVAQVHPQLMYQ